MPSQQRPNPDLLRKDSKGKGKASQFRNLPWDGPHIYSDKTVGEDQDRDEKFNVLPPHLPTIRVARGDQSSMVLESPEELRRATPASRGGDPLRRAAGVRLVQNNNWGKLPLRSNSRSPNSRFAEKDKIAKENRISKPDMSYGSNSPATARPIQPPPRDLESISRIDASLVFEHFTTSDAWELGSALRSRLLPIPTPVVINISLANQNQTLFHSCTHSGVMPDNEIWVNRKRKTVLRWGCSTWFMNCKFAGDEIAFRQKYGLGTSAGEYAIHGGGVPIRVTGVEGVVAVVVVSGLKQDEDHAVIVEVIRDLYY